MATFENPPTYSDMCDVCDKNLAVGVACIPFMPVSVGYCRECLKANAHPWWALVANTACIGGLEHGNKAWQQMVHDTLKHLGRTIEEFNEAVKKSIEEERGEIK